MKLIRLELQGFKSFAKKTELQFGSGVTAVIGPNGSGKSNISDAVRWVLGEQSAKALRGSKMDDVIFNGTQKRRAQSFCEVALTFDNGDATLPSTIVNKTGGKSPLEFNELCVSRRVYRNGGSEYSINGTNCRLMDVQELFRDTGIGKDGYSVIGQGKVDEILSGKTDDRRAALEEAAGVTRYRARKEEAERKLAATEKNMERIHDIMSELEQRVEPLRIQSERAREYLKLSAELKELEINAFLYRTDRNVERIKIINSGIAEVDEQREQNAIREGELVKACAELEKGVYARDALMATQQDELMNMIARLESRLGEYRLHEERKANAERSLEELKEREKQNAESIALLENKLAGFEDGAERQGELEELERKVAEGSAELESFDAELSKKEEELEQRKNAIMEEMNRISDAKVAVSRYDAMLTSLNERRLALVREREEAEKQLGNLDIEKREALGEQEKLNTEQQSYNRELRASVQNRESIAEGLVKNTQDQRAAEQKLGADESRLKLLNEMKRSREGYQNSVRMLMLHAEKEARLKNRLIGVVAELISVPRELETAISVALGGSLQNIVTPTAEDAKDIIEYLREKQLGRVTLLPLTLLQNRPLEAAEQKLLCCEGCLGIASELISCDEAARGAIDYLLGRTVVVRDLDTGIALKKKAGGAFHIVTQKGDYISVGGTMTGGSNPKHGYELIGREREIEELTRDIKLERTRMHEYAERAESIKRELLLADTQTDGFKLHLHELDVAIALQREKNDMIIRDIRKAQEQLRELDEEAADIRDNINELTERSAAAEHQSTAAELANSSTREDIIRGQHRLTELKAQREERSGRLTELRICKAELVKEADAQARERLRVTGELDSAKSESLSIITARERQTLVIAEAQSFIESIDTQVKEQRAEADRLKREQKRLEEERTREQEQLRVQRNARDELISSRQALDESKHALELQRERLETENRQSNDLLWQKYELTYENAAKYRRKTAIGVVSADINSLRGQIRGIGNVNPEAIQEYEAVSARYGELSRQYEDLMSAKGDLNTLLTRLTGTMEKIFAEEFVKLQANFSRVFTRLFGGGQAELKLSDSRDVLNCDIDIIAQPPGKKLQLLTLLSGGERAMTAIALLFALLQQKAPAFCILDEIESSLDEENVSKFAEFLRGYSDETQFILITHRKGSMAAAGTLYGVVMEEKGVSSIVSARFEDAS